MMLYTPVRSLTLVEQQGVWNGRQRKIKNLMCQIDKKEALSVIADIKDWQARYENVENLPLAFYLKYKKLLSSYKDAGKSKEEVLYFFSKIAEDYQDGSTFVHEIMDLIEGYCRPDFRVWSK
ncbi:hypothetical protein [Prevotella jejuni]|mgnify:FL=1|uniref:hypothetical protein n=1 Tax=Prevotella jejuni TaxID=1177574 RepID=UPI00352EA293